MIYFGGNEIGSVKWGSLDVSKAYLGSQEVWSEHTEPSRALKFTGRAAQNSLSVEGYRPPALDLEYSTNGSTWQTFTVGSTRLTFGNGESVWLRAGANGNSTWSSSSTSYNMIRTAGEIIAEGPIGALLDQEEDPATIPNGCFCMLFYGGKLVDASKLDFPWESIPNQAYDSVFYGNNLLTAAPMLPASAITDRSYYSMFNGCNALTSLSVQLTSWNSTAFNATRYWLKNVSSDGEFWCPEVLGTN